MDESLEELWCQVLKWRRETIAWEIIRRVDTVVILNSKEEIEIHRRAQAGEFDDFDFGKG
jgi:hypothetical protein